VGASLLPFDQLTEGDLAAWRELAEAAVEPNPFFHPDFALTVAEGLGSSGISVLVVREGGDWLACLPVERGRGWRRIPLHGLVVWNHLYCYLCTPLVRADRLDAAMMELLDEGVRRSAGFLGLDLLPTDGPVSEALERSAAALGRKPVELGCFERAMLARRENGDYLAFSAKHRRNFERLRRNLERDLGGELSLRDRSDDLEARQEFLRLEASGWKGDGGTRTAFAPSGHTELFLGICERTAASGMLQLVSAEIGRRSVAMLCNFVSGDTVFTFKIATDVELAKYSPGIQLSILFLGSLPRTAPAQPAPDPPGAHPIGDKAKAGAVEGPAARQAPRPVGFAQRQRLAAAPTHQGAPGQLRQAEPTSR
jgi:CelD/BcsL family acetyltransferase involved in cellulose biosynthesis